MLLQSWTDGLSSNFIREFINTRAVIVNPSTLRTGWCLSTRFNVFVIPPITIEGAVLSKPQKPKQVSPYFFFFQIWNETCLKQPRSHPTPRLKVAPSLPRIMKGFLCSAAIQFYPQELLSDRSILAGCAA